MLEKSVSYYIEGFLMPFHDLPELFEYLVNSGKYVIQHQGLTVYLGNCPLFWIYIKFPSDGRRIVTYIDYPKVEPQARKKSQLCCVTRATGTESPER